MTHSAAGHQLLLDRYHLGVRAVALAWWAAATALLYLGGMALWGLILGEAQGWLWLPWLLASLFLSQFLGRWGEQQLLRLWPSGRALELSGPRLTLHEKTGTQTFDLTRKVNYWRWGFQVRNRRGGRVPNGHYCCALRLVQDVGGAGGAASASLYAFLPPQQAAALRERYPFYELRRPNETAPAGAPGQLGGREATFLAAERARWEGGAELEPADFETLVSHLSQHLPDFSAPLS